MAASLNEEEVMFVRKSRFRSDEEGTAVIELSLILVLVLLLSGGVLEWGLSILLSQTLQRSVRDGARVATTLENLLEDDARIDQVVRHRIQSSISAPFFSNLVVENSSVVPGNGVVNQAGNNCDDQVTVRASATVNFGILTVVGFDGVDLAQRSTMRYLRQELCT